MQFGYSLTHLMKQNKIKPNFYNGIYLKSTSLRNNINTLPTGRDYFFVVFVLLFEKYILL